MPSLEEYNELPYRYETFEDPRDKGWVVRYADLRGCKGYGATPEEALARAREMKTLWLKTALKKGIQVPRPTPEPLYSGKLNLRLPRSLHERAAQAASIEGVSLNTFLTTAIAQWVERSDAGFIARLRNISDQLPDHFAVSGSVTHRVELKKGNKDKPLPAAEAAKLPSATPEE